MFKLAKKLGKEELEALGMRMEERFHQVAGKQRKAA